MQAYADSHVLLYLVTRPSPMDFRLFLLRHVPLLRVLVRWTVRLLLPRKLVKARLAYLHAAREQLATPLHPSVVETLEWLFPERKRLAEPGAAPLTPATSTPPAPSARRISSALPTVAGRSQEHALDGRLDCRGGRHRPRTRTGRMRRAVPAVPASLPPG